MNAPAGGVGVPPADGVLIVDKPRGPTSHDLVSKARRHFGTRRVGHAGTLDPMATGVLVLLLGEATKLSAIASGHDKTYVAEVEFGIGTDTHDAMGTPTPGPEAPTLVDRSSLDAALALERERALQDPPIVSAIKVGGQRAYRLARRGIAPALEARSVLVRSLEVLEHDGRRARLELRVSAGYYVRALARDLGERLGVPAHLSSLRRIESGEFSIEDACVWPPPPSQAPRPLAVVLPELMPTVRLCEAGVLRATQGKLLGADDFIDDPDAAALRWRARQGDEPAAARESPPVWGWTDAAGSPVALGRRTDDGYRVQRGFKRGATG